MSTKGPLITLFDYRALKRLFLIVLGISLLPIAEMAIYSRALSIWSVDLVVAVTAATGFVGYFYLVLRVRRLLKFITARIDDGDFPEQHVVRLLGIIAGGVLLLIPGFLSDALGLLLLVSFFKSLVGRLLLRLFGGRIKGAYEYLKLS